MKTGRFFIFLMGFLPFLALSCMQEERISSPQDSPSARQVGFDISVTRDGKQVSRRSVRTKSGAYDEGDQLATMNMDIPFGLVGVDMDTHTLLVDNTAVYNNGNGYKGYLDGGLWDIPAQISFSAYYPYVHNVVYENGYESYSIPYTVEATSAGPLISKTVEMAVAQMDMMPLEFQHITNDIGYAICDVTPAKELQGLIHLRKVIAYNVASAGIFVNDITLSKGIWHRQGYYRNVTVFEGDAKLGVGSDNELYVGSDELVARKDESNRYYSIPDEIVVGKQYVEVIFDVEGFNLNGFDYPPLENQSLRYMLYGLLPDNVFVYGRQYTFHIGVDLSRFYTEITFSPSVEGWETKIYENNEDF